VVQNFIKLLREGKVWETEADAEPGEKATGVGSASKAAGAKRYRPASKAADANKPRPACKAAGAEKFGPACKAAGTERSRPAGKATSAETKWPDEEGGNIADQIPEIYRE
jgi:hypothetical protein